MIIMVIGVGTSPIWLQGTSDMLKNFLTVVSLSLDIPRRWMCIFHLYIFLDLTHFLRILWWICIFIVPYNEFEVIILDLFQIVDAIFVGLIHITMLNYTSWKVMQVSVLFLPYLQVLTSFSGFPPCYVRQCYHFSQVFAC